MPCTDAVTSRQIWVLLLAGSVGTLMLPSGPLCAEPRGQRYAFLVACGDYDQKELRPLKYTRNDISAFHRVLLDSGFPTENIVLMHESQSREYLPEAKKSRTQLALLLRRAGANDDMVVRLSGHD